MLPSTICTVSAPRIGNFRGSMAGLCAPLSTLRRGPHGQPRMTRGRCGSLHLHRKGLAPSVTAFREALQELTRARVPLQWAGTQVNLGHALGALGERESGTARLEAAAAAFREALQELTRARVPLQWAGTQVNLGTALGALGERESGTARLEEAISAFREASQELTR